MVLKMSCKAQLESLLNVIKVKSNYEGINHFVVSNVEVLTKIFMIPF